MPCNLPSYNAAPQNCGLSNLSVLSQGFPADALSEPNTPSLFSLDKNLRTPYVMQWHLTFQYQLDQNTMLEASYVGSKANKEYIFLNLNQAAPTADPSAAYAPRRPYSYVDASIYYLRSGGNANDNALQLSLQHRLTHGLSLITNYTYSKSLGDSSSANLGSQNNDAFRYTYNPNIEYGPLDFDVRNRFVNPRNARVFPGHGSNALCQGTTLVGPHRAWPMRASAPEVRFFSFLTLSLSGNGSKKLYLSG